MYNALVVLLAGAALGLFWLGVSRRDASRAVCGLLLLLATGLFFGLLSFWGEMLWFEALGYGRRFWTVVAARLGLCLGGMALGMTAVYLLTWGMPRKRGLVRHGPAALGAAIGGFWGLAHWDTALMYLHGVPTGIRDPIFGRSVGFYLFSLPMYDALYWLLLLLTAIALLANVAVALVGARELMRGGGEIILIPSPERLGGKCRSLYASGAAFIFALAWGRFLARYHLMYSTSGAVEGPGWTDVHVRLPAYPLVIALMVSLGLLLTVSPLRRRWQRLLKATSRVPDVSSVMAVASVGLAVAGIWLVAFSAVPALFQWLYVEPNEITLEQPYIAHNIDFTRRAFDLHRVEEREFSASGDFTRDTVRRNQALFANVRLWDWRALSSVYRQFQEIRLYYKFADVDIDRYALGGTRRQVMVSARELDLENLPEQSQTFVNRHFKYTHGYGLAMSDVSEFTAEGLPNLLVKNLPARAAFPELDLERPQIYYGELTHSYAVANSSEAEFDYPSGDENAYIHYPGQGGVPLAGLWRRFVFGWKFDGTRLFMSGYPQPESRIMFHRQVRERVQNIAPFLRFDDDPYLVLVRGRLYWIIDAYTTSGYYPYSQPFSSRVPVEYDTPGRRLGLFSLAAGYLDGVNYLRNSVKAVVDAFDGTVDLYVFDAEDPLIQVWSRVFPRLFRQKASMPRALLEHVRYPADMLLVQGLVYAKYHMTSPAVFYNQEDLWVRATENYYGRVQPVEPYYIMWRPPGSDEPEFVLMMPFTPKKRQVLIGWIAGMCDPDNYGRFLVYKFPKEKRVLGPQQVETKIDQDPFLSGQLTLWDQRGSNVIRGNVLAIPVDETLLYVEPIYLRAETAAYPELRLVVVMHGDRLSYGETFDKALAGLFARGEETVRGDGPAGPGAEGLETVVRQAGQAFEQYLDALAERRFDESSRALETLQEALRRLERQVLSGTGAPPAQGRHGEGIEAP